MKAVELYTNLVYNIGEWWCHQNWQKWVNDVVKNVGCNDKKGALKNEKKLFTCICANLDVLPSVAIVYYLKLLFNVLFNMHKWNIYLKKSLV